MAHAYRSPSDWTDGRLPETEAQYRRAANRFERLAWKDQADGSMKWGGYIAGVHRYLHTRKGRLSRSTFRWYRNAATFRAVELFGEDRQALVHADLAAYSPQGKKRERYRKAVPTHVMRAIQDVVEADGRRSWRELFDVLVVMRTTGARPGELSGMLYNNLSGVLELPNSKYRPAFKLAGLEDDIRQRARSYPRGNGTFRLLEVQPGWRDNPAFVKMAYRVIRRFKGRSWDEFQANSSRTLKEILKRCVREKRVTWWWKRLRVYDFRHQFCADAKESLSFLRGEVAAAMGHLSATTALYHYGRRANAGKGGLAVRPVAGEGLTPAFPMGRTALGVATDSLKKLARLVSKARETFARDGAKTGPEQAGRSATDKDSALSDTHNRIDAFWRDYELNNPPDTPPTPPPRRPGSGPKSGF